MIMRWNAFWNQETTFGTKILRFMDAWHTHKHIYNIACSFIVLFLFFIYFPYHPIMLFLLVVHGIPGIPKLFSNHVTNFSMKDVHIFFKSCNVSKIMFLLTNTLLWKLYSTMEKNIQHAWEQQHQQHSFITPCTPHITQTYWNILINEHVSKIL